MECFLSASTTTLRANEVKVSLAPFCSYAAAYFFRNAMRAVMSASSNWVTRGVVLQLSVIRRAMTSRRGEMGAFETGPHLEKSICSCAGLGAGAPADAAPRGAAARR